MTLRYVGALVCIAFLTACSSQVGIEGEVFVENNGVATKLANVDIQIIPEDVFAKYIKTKLQNSGAEKVKLEGRIESLKKSIADLEKSANDVMNAQMKLAAMGGGFTREMMPSPLMAQANSQVSQTLDATGKYKQDIGDIQTAIAGLNSGKNGDYYYANSIDGALLKVTTNADGKFKFDVPTGKPYILMAAKGGNYWFLHVPQKGKSDFNLTNANSLKTNCDICVFNGTKTPESM